MEFTRILISRSVTAPPRHTIRTKAMSREPRSRTTFSTRQRSNALRCASVVAVSAQIGVTTGESDNLAGEILADHRLRGRPGRRLLGERRLGRPNLLQRGLPATLEFGRDETIVGIDAVELPLRQCRGVSFPLDLVFRAGRSAASAWPWTR